MKCFTHEDENCKTPGCEKRELGPVARCAQLEAVNKALKEELDRIHRALSIALYQRDEEHRRLLDLQQAVSSLSDASD